MPQQTATPSSSYDDGVRTVLSGNDADVQTDRQAITKGEAVPPPVIQRLLEWSPAAKPIRVEVPGLGLVEFPAGTA